MPGNTLTLPPGPPSEIMRSIETKPRCTSAVLQNGTSVRPKPAENVASAVKLCASMSVTGSSLRRSALKTAGGPMDPLKWRDCTKFWRSRLSGFRIAQAISRN